MFAQVLLNGNLGPSLNSIEGLHSNPNGGILLAPVQNTKISCKDIVNFPPKKKGNMYIFSCIN